MDDFTRKALESGEALARRIVSIGIDGAGPFKGARVVAEESLRHTAGDREAAIRRVIRTQVRLAGTEGFLTGLPGGAAVIVAVPTDVTAFYVLAGRMVAAVAHLRGYDVHDDDVRSAILVALLGASGTEFLREFGIEAGKKGLGAAFKKVPGRVLLEINKKVGFRLITKAGEKGLINLGKIVPFVGGPIGAALNASGMRTLGAYAKTMLPTVPPDDADAAAVPGTSRPESLSEADQPVARGD